MADSPRIRQADVGSYYLGPDDVLWRLIAYADQPTATFDRVTPRSEAGGGGGSFGGAFQIAAPRKEGLVGSTLFDGFRKLVPDGPVSEQVARCAFPGCPSEDVYLVAETLRIVSLERPPVESELVFVCSTHDHWLRTTAADCLVFVGERP